MIIKKDWQKRFANRINKEISAYKKEGVTEQNRWILTGMKDMIYLLGESINKDDFSFADGFQRFCKEMQIDFEGNKNA